MGKTEKHIDERLVEFRVSDCEIDDYFYLYLREEEIEVIKKMEKATKERIFQIKIASIS